MEEVHRCDRCGALGHNPAHAEHRTRLRGHAVRMDPTVTLPGSTARGTRMNENIVMASPHGLPATRELHTSVPTPVHWPQLEDGFVLQGGEK